VPRAFVASAILGVVLALGAGIAILFMTGPEECPKYGGDFQPHPDYCVRPDPLSGVYRIPDNVTLTNSSGAVAQADRDLSGTYPPAIGLMRSLPVLLPVLVVVVFVAQRLSVYANKWST
jgi:hypothetical protein